MGFNVTTILVEQFVQELQKGYEKAYGNMNGNYKEIIIWAGR